MSYIASNWSLHSPETVWYQNTKKELEKLIKRNTRNSVTVLDLETIGTIQLPYFKMGNITSLNLFGLDELIIFSLYKKINNQKFALDLGANLGLHTIVLSRLGLSVIAVEPDPIHLDQLRNNLGLNLIENVLVKPAAVSTANGVSEFIRVKGNTTGSHLADSTGKNPYGGVDKFKVSTLDFNEILRSINGSAIVKMDVEGYESKLITNMKPENIKKFTLIIEVGNHENAKDIFKFLDQNKIVAYSQVNGWKKVKILKHMPKNYKDGSLVIPEQLKDSNLPDTLNYWF